MGCPVISQLEVVSVGKTEDNIEAFIDRAAYEADGVMLINRTKWHTDFSGKIESGLFKMMAIGLGKFAGARRYHTYGYKLGLEHVIRSVGRLVLKSGKIVGGLAILEDAYHHTAKLDAVTAGNMEQREQENLALATLLDGDDSGRPRRSHARRDRQAHQRRRHGLEGGEPRLRSRAQSVLLIIHRFERIFIRDLSPLSYGNAIGLGLAEIVTDRLVNKTDWEPTRINGLTALGLASHPHADSLAHRSRVPGGHYADRRQVRDERSHRGLDSVIRWSWERLR